ncbi:NAD-dependent protein deacylase sirtuin-5, mitochondrial [Candidatus Magnetaquicoccaceae bacterium FCR-1]|uniref:protein acetyllysine N-acetyltransferase n=1 Tax=Candidatus Magnetaquiglobus chichijimensis TaxID=3141448 RepID=A0ABQ0C8U3_9PROT
MSTLPDDPLIFAAHAVLDADALLITAGAGMGVDSGLPDFRGKEGFWNAYPVIARLGLSFPQMANPDWFRRDPRLAWAFYGHRLDLYRRVHPHAGFAQLLQIAQEKPHGGFVLTSNVDGHFQKAGWPEERVAECHGSIHQLQCTRPCSSEIWSDERLSLEIDPESFRVTGSLPVCPRCGALARPNILMFSDGHWLEKRSAEQEARMQHWLSEVHIQHARLLILEIGAGNAVPTIRQSSEHFARKYAARLIRINPRDSWIPPGRHIALPMGGNAAITQIRNLITHQESPDPLSDSQH